jgi:hypothetical protein
MNIVDLYMQAELALAAYAKNLSPGTPDIEALKDRGQGMSATQANRFAEQWNVIDQFTDSASGVSATTKGVRVI